MTEVVLEIKNLSKSFPGVKALTNVDLIVGRGEIHALMGENGAGKSTLIKVLTGLYRKDSGEILLEGENFEPHSPAETSKYGISTVYQEINLIPTLSVAENIFIGRQPQKKGRIDWNTLREKADMALKKLNIDIDVRENLGTYSVALQQLVAIARALDISAKILIFDEPTSCLDTSETQQLFSIMRQLRDSGVSIIFVTHFIDQVYDISDHITILRNGTLVGHYITETLPKVELISKMLGKELAEFEIAATTETSDAGSGNEQAFYSVRGMEKPGVMSSFDLDIKKGEVLGLTGLLGSGKTETAKLLFGIIKAQKGDCYLKGQKIAMTSPRKAIENRLGFCPEDRKEEGIVSGLTVRENIILALQARQGIFRTIKKVQQKQIAEKFIDMLKIATPSVEQTIDNLSGGNQQKVIVARWLVSNPDLLILDEPTRGIDVGAKAEIQKLIINLSRDGMAVLFISSFLEEVVRCCDRVAVLRDRKKIGELHGDRIKEDAIMHTIANGRIQ